MSAVLISEVPAEYSRNPEHREIGDEMGANVSVIGVNDGMGGLKESQAKFRKHHEEVGAALMNISGVGTATGDKVDKDEPRPGYQHEEYPFMLYKAGEELGRVVKSKAERDEAMKEGWRVEPFPKPQVEVLDPATEKKALMEQNRQLQAQLQKLIERIDKVESKK